LRETSRQEQALNNSSGNGGNVLPLLQIPFSATAATGFKRSARTL
jgi:hypothetical protein